MKSAKITLYLQSNLLNPNLKKMKGRFILFLAWTLLAVAGASAQQPDAVALTDSAISLYNARQLDAAAALAQQACELNPTDVNNYEVLARVAIRQGRFNDAIGYYEKAIELSDEEEAAEYRKLIGTLRDIRDTPPAAERDTVMTDEVTLPLFPGGREAERDFITSHIHYPQAAFKAGEEGDVTVECTINEQGRVTDAVVVKGASETLNAEALRLCTQDLPTYAPATVKGVPTPCQYQISVKFRINQIKSSCNISK